MLTGTVWADTVWLDVWGPIWAASSIASVQNTILRMTPAPGSRSMFINIQQRQMTPEPDDRCMMVIKNG